MAIPNSPEWSLASINHMKSSRNPIPISIFSEPFKSHPIFSLLCLNSRALIAKSSSCSSVPVLEDASSTTSPVIQLDLKLQDLDDQVSSLPETEDLNGLICALFEDSRTEELAYDYYERAKDKPDFRPKKLTLKLVIRYLINSRNWGLLYSLCEDFKSFQVLPDGSTCYRLISSCSRARKFKLVNTLLGIFSADESIAFLAFDAAMKGYNKLHMYSSSISLYERMKSNGIVLDSGCYYHIMEAYMKIGRYENAVSLFEEFETKDFGSTPFTPKIYWILCESLGKLRRPFEALDYFREMTKRGILENHLFYSSLISSFLSMREVKMAEELLEEAESKKMLRDPALFLKLVLMYIEEGLVERTLDVVKMMNRVSIRVSDCILCAIVNGFSKRRGLNAAVKVYEDLILQGCEPGQVTYASIQNIYFRLGQYFKAEMIFSEMEEKGFDKCVVAYASMVAMYGKTGRVGDAMRLVAKMKERGCEPNVWIYNSLLDMHGRGLNLRQVEKIWKEMNRRKVLPDRVSYTSVISAYSRAREFETCMRYYQEFRLNGGAIDRAMAAIMVAVFSKLNRADELVKLLQDMKTEGTKLDVRLYRSALNALRDAGLHVQAKWLQESFGKT
ncbi:pentatricopeptide repeat-containing protein At5g13770, chloroplastic-like [Coffea arabica]|uniref:Pentatricopeptide repeat-containing protein At5g13770, chloroplastic-like n=1 Tax=Coffea arabica TaxID=13443 RepID=A0A6P6V529_COFAR|nr:pentatricopeptide repeat-containing protein At5g13770, chloroplastic-like [Coffea arabica]